MKRIACGMAASALAWGCAAHAANGDFDTSFGSAGIGFAGVATASLQLPPSPVVQADGRILACSVLVGTGSSGDDIFVARFRADGTLDTSFSFDGRVTVDFGGDETCNAIAVQSDGKIVVVGTTSANGNGDYAIARLNADGTLDTNFGGGTGKTIVPFDLGGSKNDIASSVAIQPDGKIVVAGWADNATDEDFAIVRLLPDGSRDPAFNLTGRVTVAFDLGTGKTDQASSVAIDAAGNIVVGGVAQSAGGGFDFAVARLKPNGQLDADFDGDGRATVAFDLGDSGNDLCYHLLLQRDGRIVLVGNADTSPTSTANGDMAIARLLPDGSPDDSFGIHGKTVVSFDLMANGADGAFGVAEQGNGKLVLVGVAQWNDTPAFQTHVALVRLDADGSLDPQFGAFGKKVLDFGAASPGSQYGFGVALQGTAIIVSGIANRPGPDNPSDLYVARLQNDLIFADGFQ